MDDNRSPVCERCLRQFHEHCNGCLTCGCVASAQYQARHTKLPK